MATIITCVVLALLLMTGVPCQGDIQKRIKRGRTCLPEESKQHVFLETDNQTHISICSGSLIAKGMWVLTAAHCDAYGTQIQVKNLNGQEDVVRQSSIIKVGQTDLMLLKLSKTMSTAVTLPTNEHCTKFKASGENVVFVARNTKEKEKKNTDSVKCANGKVKLWEEEMEDVGVFNVYKTKRLSVLNRGDSGGGALHQNVLYGVISAKQKYKRKLKIPKTYYHIIDVCTYKDRIEQIINSSP